VELLVIDVDDGGGKLKDTALLGIDDRLSCRLCFVLSL